MRKLLKQLVIVLMCPFLLLTDVYSETSISRNNLRLPLSSSSIRERLRSGAHGLYSKGEYESLKQWISEQREQDNVFRREDLEVGFSEVWNSFIFEIYAVPCMLKERGRRALYILPEEQNDHDEMSVIEIYFDEYTLENEKIRDRIIAHELSEIDDLLNYAADRLWSISDLLTFLDVKGDRKAVKKHLKRTHKSAPSLPIGMKARDLFRRKRLKIKGEESRMIREKIEQVSDNIGELKRTIKAYDYLRRKVPHLTSNKFLRFRNLFISEVSYSLRREIDLKCYEYVIEQIKDFCPPEMLYSVWSSHDIWYDSKFFRFDKADFKQRCKEKITELQKKLKLLEERRANLQRQLWNAKKRESLPVRSGANVNSIFGGLVSLFRSL